MGGSVCIFADCTEQKDTHKCGVQLILVSSSSFVSFIALRDHVLASRSCTDTTDSSHVSAIGFIHLAPSEPSVLF